MPCYKCANGKYKYGERGRCQFDTLEACQAAERAIHARQNEKEAIDEAAKLSAEITLNEIEPRKKPKKS